MSLVSFENVTIDYGHVRAVSDVSFDINEGDYTCIVGSNGSGKSTIIKGLLGLTALSGGVINLNLDKADIAYVPQTNTTIRKFPATVYEIVITGTQKKQNKLPFYTKNDIKTAHDAISLMGIENISKKQIGQLSGGQQQRVMLARAICKDPKMLVLDEPCVNLDEQITKDLSDLLEMLNKQKNITIFMASHNIKAINRLASKVLVLDKKLKFYGDLKHYNEFKRG